MDYSMSLKFSSNNKTLTMKRSEEFKILTIEGIEGSEYTIYKADSNQDGMVVTGRKIEPREIIITGDIKKNDNEDINRKKLISFFNPKRTGRLVITRNDVSRMIDYEVSSFNFTNTKMWDWTTFEIILECPDPLLSSTDNYGKNIALITPQFAFPLVILEGKGKIMGYKTYKNDVDLENDGDVPTGFKVVITAESGTVTNPKISLGSGEYIEVITTMEEGDVLTINTNDRNKSITLNDENVINKINRGSTFFNLEVGTNTITYDAEDGYTNMKVNIYYYKKYIGM